MTKSWTLEVQQHEDGEHFIEFPDDVLQEAGWKEGDVIEWIDNKDGSWTLQKKLDENQENTESKE
jgi:bifunctional DNA-binding transcriptional regulator/antitoxin component of YhaV-PrlF toxin-antitoxin module